MLCGTKLIEITQWTEMTAARGHIRHILPCPHCFAFCVTARRLRLLGFENCHSFHDSIGGLPEYYGTLASGEFLGYLNYQRQIFVVLTAHW
jgi:aldehyde:ferredoxin oxidoreductase